MHHLRLTNLREHSHYHHIAQLNSTCCYLYAVFLLRKRNECYHANQPQIHPYFRHRPPVIEMPASFNLELSPGQMVALDTTCSTEDLDMSRMEDGTLVDGSFWGCLKIVHDQDTHQMDFTGTRLNEHQDLPADFWFDSRVVNKLVVAAKPTTAKCHISIYSPEKQYVDLTLNFSPMWKIGLMLPSAEIQSDSRAKYFLRVHPGGPMEHFDSNMVVTSLYFETM